MLYLLVAKDGRTFYEEANDPKEIVNKACIPLKAIFDEKMVKVWENKD